MKFLKGLALLCACVLMFAAAELCRQTIETEKHLTATVDQAAGAAQERLRSIQDAVLELADKHLGRIEGVANTHLTRIEGTVNAAVNKVDKQLTAGNQTLASLAGNAGRQLSSIAGDVHQVATPAASIAAQVQDAAPLYLDCDHNPDCAFNRFQGTAKAVERMAQEGAKAAPAMVADAAKITGHTERITAAVEKEADQLTKPKKWYQRLESWIELAAYAVMKGI